MPRGTRALRWRTRVTAATLVFACGAASSLRAQDATPQFRPRIDFAARYAIPLFNEWLGPLEAAPEVPVDRLWLSAPGSMDVESQVSYRLARRWFSHVTDVEGTVPFADSVAWYLQGRIGETLYDRQYLRTAHSMDSTRFFGGAVPWAFRVLPLDRWSGGLGRLEWLRLDNRRAWPAPGRRLPAGFNPLAIRGALAFGTLERYLGWPALQGALRLVAEQRRAPITSAAARAIIADAVGQDLSWLFDTAFDSNLRYSYALTSLRSQANPDPCDGDACFTTRITVERLGSAVFTAPQLAVEFSDRQRATTRVDGRLPSQTLEFVSPAPAVAARLDPDRVLLLDDNYLDNSRRTAAPSNVPVGKWAVRWLVWLQGAMLDYGLLF